MSIESLAEEVVAHLTEAVPDLPNKAPLERAMIVTVALTAKDGPAAALVAAFMEDSSFGNLRNGWVQQPGGYGCRLAEHSVPFRIVEALIVGKPTGPIIQEAREFTASPTSATSSYTALAGATVTEPINLSDDVELVPWAEVPDSDRKKIFDLSGRDFSVVQSAFQAFANMAIRVRFPECQVLFASNKKPEEVQGEQRTIVTERTTQTADIVRCIGLESESSVAQLGSWTTFDKESANRLAGTGSSFTGHLFDMSILFASHHPVELDARRTASLVRAFEALDSSSKDPLRITADRFNQAVCEQNVTDKAIDLGIALEVMLLHNIGAKERGELKYRSSVRGAMFLGGDKAARLRTFELLKSAYDLRSRAVHAGTLKPKKNEPPPAEVLEEASKICARIARKLIERGEFPDWEAQYVIGEL